MAPYSIFLSGALFVDFIYFFFFFKYLMLTKASLIS